MFKEKEHLDLSGFNIIITLKEGMNSKRTYFNWLHLEKFYSSYLKQN